MMTVRQAIQECRPLLEMYGIKHCTPEGLDVIQQMYARVLDALNLINDNETNAARHKD